MICLVFKTKNVMLALIYTFICVTYVYNFLLSKHQQAINISSCVDKVKIEHT